LDGRTFARTEGEFAKTIKFMYGLEEKYTILVLCQVALQRHVLRPIQKPYGALSLAVGCGIGVLSQQTFHIASVLDLDRVLEMGMRDTPRKGHGVPSDLAMSRPPLDQESHI
jgi:hypothetical protein